jgi:hypothetical protein
MSARARTRWMMYCVVTGLTFGIFFGAIRSVVAGFTIASGVLLALMVYLINEHHAGRIR